VYTASSAITGSVFTATAEHLTVNAYSALLPDPALTSFSFVATNSIFSRVSEIELHSPTPLVGLDGDFNGFDQSTTPFGSESHLITVVLPPTCQLVQA